MIEQVQKTLSRISVEILGVPFEVKVHRDKKDPENGRLYLQVSYYAPCVKGNAPDLQWWKGRKWYLSDHMTEDEIIKTAFAAVKAAVDHEVMEGYKVDDIILFNPHVSFEELLKVSHIEVQREPVKP
jgi:hypothetical protein